MEMGSDVTITSIPCDELFLPIAEPNPALLQIQLMSDIHLEFPMVWKRFPRIRPMAPILALCGDIAKPDTPAYREMLTKYSPLYELILVVAGNHEYYGHEYYSAQKKLQELCDTFPNVLFMQKRSIVVRDRWRIVGTTLWSYVPDENAKDVSMCLNDYHLISIQKPNEKKRNLKVEDTVAFFQDEIQYIKDQIEEAKRENQRVVVLTHHAPLMNGTSHPQYDGSPTNCAFSSDLRSILGPPVALWCFGHTHYSSEQNCNGTKVISNQLGYMSSNEQPNFTPNFVLNVPPSPNMPVGTGWVEVKSLN